MPLLAIPSIKRDSPPHLIILITATKENHAITNCKGQLENIIELYKLSQQADKEGSGNAERDFIEEATEMALDVC